MTTALLFAAPAAAGTIGTVSVAADATGADVAIEVRGGSGTPTTFALDAPKRLVIDVPGATTGAITAAGGGPVAKVRGAQFDSGTVRVVLDLAAPAHIVSGAARDGGFSIRVAPIDEAAFARQVADGRKRLIPPPETETAAAAAPPKPVTKPPPKTAEKQAAATAEPPAARPTPSPRAAPAAAATTAPQPSPPVPRQRLRTGLPVVVIDAGHGGKDVGAPSVLGDGRHEKDVTLAIAKAIKKELDASGRVRAILTRSDDRFLRLRDRLAIARHNRAELFISVHADSAPTPQASGATVYTLSETASDAEAARLAAKENRADIIAGVDLGVETSEVTDILIDLAQRETMNRSAEFAALLQRELRQDIKVRSQFHRFAGFLVLKAPDVPSVLLETGYLSNGDDSKFLFSPAGQVRIARGVRRAIEGHFLRRIAQR